MADVIRALYRLLRPAKVVRVYVRDLTFTLPGREDGDVADLIELADVLTFHEGKLVLRNCHISGAVSFELHQHEGVMIISGMAGSAIRYEPPS
jgi:hypothetical protein